MSSGYAACACVTHVILLSGYAVHYIVMIPHTVLCCRHIKFSVSLVELTYQAVDTARILFEDLVEGRNEEEENNERRDGRKDGLLKVMVWKQD